MEAEPPELVSIASAVGCQQVCLFTNIPVFDSSEAANSSSPFPLVTESNRQLLRARLRDTGVAIANIEFFSLTPGLDIESYRHGLELGSELGARCAVTHIYDPDPARALDNLGRLSDMAAEYALDVALEFMGVSPDCASIQRAVDLVQQVRRDNLGIAVDMLHLVRTGGTPEDVAAVSPGLIRYAQLCDGADMRVCADYMEEALHARMVPGAGCFPLRELLEALPQSTPLDVEVPRLARQQAGMPALARAQQAVSASRRLIAAARVSR